MGRAEAAEDQKKARQSLEKGTNQRSHQITWGIGIAVRTVQERVQNSAPWCESIVQEGGLFTAKVREVPAKRPRGIASRG